MGDLAPERQVAGGVRGAEMEEDATTILEVPCGAEAAVPTAPTFRFPAGSVPLPVPTLRASVVVPIRDEAPAIPTLVRSLHRQRQRDGRPFDPARFEVILLCNGCRDGSAEVARRAAADRPDLRLHVVELGSVDAVGGVGRARRLLMDEAADRLARIGRADRGMILTTDADSIVAPDWLTANLEALASGADAVGGQVLMDPRDLAALPPSLRRRYLDDHSYQRLRATLEGLIAPDPDDPLPRHHQHAGASLAVTVGAYWRAGGMPPLGSGEDEAFHRAIRRSGGRFRHSLRVRVSTSGRLAGRADRGLAETLSRWRADGGRHLVESAGSLERRFLDRAGVLGRATGPGPTREPVGAAIAGLRALIRRYAAERSRRSSR